MIDWVHEYCKDWADYRRKMPRAWPEKSTNWRIWKEQGASANTFGPRTPTWDMAPTALEVHRAYVLMPENFRLVMDAFYLKRCDPKKKAKMLGMSRANMYQSIMHCHCFIAGLAIEKDSRLSDVSH